MNNFSSDRLTNICFVFKNLFLSYKPSISVDNLGASTSNMFFKSERKTIFVKPTKVEEVEA